MSEEPTFSELIGRVRAGDQDAATDLVRRYESAVRRAVRIRLADTRLARAFDSMDICQSVLASFFVRAAVGQYELDTPAQLLKLLTTMARHKLADQVDRQRAKRRDNRRLEGGSPAEREIVSAAASPSRLLSAQELLDQVRQRLSPEERQIMEMRAQGSDWESVAKEMGGTPEALRKRLARASERVARDLEI